MINARYTKYSLHFRTPAGTSRGTLLSKDSWFILVNDDMHPQITGIGECSILKGLSMDDRPDIKDMLKLICAAPLEIWERRDSALAEWPALRSGLEMALLDLKNGGQQLLFPSAFTQSLKSIPINGLVWMGQPDYMLQQIDEKINSGFRVIKMKIGAIDFNEELHLLSYIRNHYNKSAIEIRVDANGAFAPEEAPDKLNQLARFDIHSIEQPIKAGQFAIMAELCRQSPIPIALDEELIGIPSHHQAKALLQTIHPQYIILKPSLLGGFEASEKWIKLADDLGIGWWVTSALESNIGLNAIAQWTATLNSSMPQGLGTGSLFTNNIPAPLKIKNGALHAESSISWDVSAIL